MPDRTITQRSARYRARAKDRGLVEVRVRVPADRAQEIRDEAARMREEAELVEFRSAITEDEARRIALRNIPHQGPEE